MCFCNAASSPWRDQFCGTPKTPNRKINSVTVINSSFQPRFLFMEFSKLAMRRTDPKERAIAFLSRPGVAMHAYASASPEMNVPGRCHHCLRSDLALEVRGWTAVKCGNLVCPNGWLVCRENEVRPAWRGQRPELQWRSSSVEEVVRHYTFIRVNLEESGKRRAFTG